MGTRAGSLGAGAGAGIVATIAMDGAMLGAALAGGDALGSERLSLQVIGRWAAGLLRGRWRHDDITGEEPVRGELLLGVATHYATGVVLTEAFALLPSRRTVPHALAYGLATSVLPLLVLFPSLGYGPFGVRSGEAGRLIRVMLIGHAAFGVGIGLGLRCCGPRRVR